MSTRAPTSRSLSHVYDAAYTGVPNWEIGRPQRAFVYLHEAGHLRTPVLDVGCGTGELALYLARQGYDVLGVDLSPLAIQQARQKAQWRRIDAEFVVWDALRLGALADAGFTFGSVVDSAMFHIFGDAERDRFVAELSRVVAPGGRYFVLGDARQRAGDSYGITPVEIRQRFEGTGDWDVVFAYETAFERRWGNSPAYLVGVQRR